MQSAAAGCRSPGASRWLHQIALAGTMGLLVLSVGVSAQGFGRKETKPKAPIIKEDIKYIRCQVCEAIVKQQLTAVRSIKEDLKPGQKLTEADILENIEKMCDPDDDAGDWITQMDLVEEGDKLHLVDTGKMSDCNSECRTIAKTCEQFQTKVDLSDIGEALFLGRKNRAAFVQWLCYDESSYCGKKVPPLPQGRKAGPKHVALDDDAVSRKKMLRKMKASGMSGTMYDRETLMDEMMDLKESSGMEDDEFEAMTKGMEDMGPPGSVSGGGDSGDASGDKVPPSDAEGKEGKSDPEGGKSGSGGGIADAIKGGAAKVAETVSSAAAGAAAAVGSVYDKVKGTVLGGGKKLEL